MLGFVKMNLWKFVVILGIIIILVYVFIKPQPFSNVPTCTVLRDAQHQILQVKIASDEQWRFPPSSLNFEKIKTAILYYEDEYFYQHLGFNPISLFKAFILNLKRWRIIRGGSTLSMQVVRLSQPHTKRSFWKKCVEIIASVKLELYYSKKDIMNFYLQHAPFGGNVVGVEAAAWKFFGRSPENVSWGEACLLAVLPNAPSKIFLGKNKPLLLIKRNQLLLKLFTTKIINNETYLLALQEPLPFKPQSFPNLAPHLMIKAIKDQKQGKNIITTLNRNLQEHITNLVEKFQKNYQANNISNMAVLVIDIPKANVLAYIGNTNGSKDLQGSAIDMIQANRSLGSILKPFLFMLAIENGNIIPESLLNDVPTLISGYSPMNFENNFEGVVPAGEALTKSLNVPYVLLLQEYGLENFYNRLKSFDFKFLNQSPHHYGLPIILGGAEGSLWEVCKGYKSLAYSLFSKPNPSIKYDKNEFTTFAHNESLINPLAIWYGFETMTNLIRPKTETGWASYKSHQKIAWKTGTSFGHKDAWCIGITPQYLIGVWVGNASGEGRPNLTGLNYAAPMMFSIASLFKSDYFFGHPAVASKFVMVCKKSGYQAGIYCDYIDSFYEIPISSQLKTCPYHQIVYLDAAMQFQVNQACYPVYSMVAKDWFVLPPMQEWFYSQHHFDYQKLPPFLMGCKPNQQKNIALIYPLKQAKIYIPKNLNGVTEKIIFQASYRLKNQPIFWHIDNHYVGSTIGEHKVALQPNLGKHTLTIVDKYGETLQGTF